MKNIARWPARSAVTVMGIALSTGLLFSMMQFLDASTSMLDTFFFRAQRQDLSVSFTEPRNADVLDELARIPAFEDAGFETAQAVLEECAKFNEGVVAPLNWVGDQKPSSWKDGVVSTTPGFKEAYQQIGRASCRERVYVLV